MIQLGYYTGDPFKFTRVLLRAQEINTVRLYRNVQELKLFSHSGDLAPFRLGVGISDFRCLKCCRHRKATWEDLGILFR